ncbi:MAG: hypothetical protein RL514_2128 [Verrucomicrobiota bacterium]|jgi:DNA-binding NarL/FixJ family response regulator
MSAKPKKRAKPTSVLVVDDHALVRYALVRLLEGAADLICDGEADGVASARAAIKRRLPEVVLLDLSLGDGDGFALIGEWRKTFPELKILVISRHEEAVYAERSLRAGATGYVTKDESSAEVLRAIREVAQGRRYVSECMAGQVTRRLEEVATPNGRSGMASLSERELQVFRLLGEGLNNKIIAEQLQLSPKTVETHLDGLKRKLGLPDAVSLIRYAANWSDRK